MKVLEKVKYVLATLILISMTSCANPEKLVESGNYDAAIDYCVRKLAGKKKKTELVQALEIAFEKANQQNMREIKQIQARDRKEEFYKIIDLANRIENRQRKVEPLLPLYDENGYKSNFEFVKTDILIEDSKKKSAEYWYAEGKKLLAKARASRSKLDARDAYKAFENVEKYLRNYKETRIYREEALSMSIVHYLVRINNESNVIMPTQMRDQLLDINLSDLNSLFRIYHKEAIQGMEYDGEVVLSIDEVIFSPESVNTREFEEEKEIKDGWKYVLDENGNVAKDSLGNDIKEDNFVIIKAMLLDSKQFKSAAVAARADFYNLRSRQKMKTVTVGTESNFVHISTRLLAGDRRALQAKTKRRLGIGPVPFPSNEQLLMNAAPDIRRNLIHAIRNNKSLL